ncbi:MAG: universal stress protein [Cyclobacteriaceae bacterium]
MKKILVPIDFSKESQNALDFARDICKETKSELLLLHVLELPSSSFNTVGEVQTVKPQGIYELLLVKKTKEDLQKELQKLEDDNIQASSKLVFGNPYQNITDLIPSENVDFIVMGSKGASGLSEILVGSNTERVIRHATCPVLTIKAPIKLENIQRIILSTDSSPDQDTILPTLKKLQKLIGFSVEVVLVRTSHNAISEESAKEFLEKYLERNHLDTLPFYTHSIYSKSVESGIMSFAATKNLSLVAMATHGRTGLDHFFKGSISEDVANHAQLAILTMKID